MANNKNKKKVVTLFRFIFTIACVGIALGVGISKVGWDNILNGNIDLVINEANQILEEIGGFQTVNPNGDSQNVYVPVSGELDIYVFDVGQADSIFVGNDGKYLLIDAGNSGDGELIVSQLEHMGISEFEYVIGTHPHEDHIGGMVDIVENFTIKNFYMPDSDYDSATYKNLRKALDKKKVRNTEPNVGDVFYVGNAKCEIMAVDGKNEDANLTSIVVEISYGEHKFLFMADAETENEEIRMWNDIDILKVGHHGSSTSTSEDFMAQIKPEVALISVGKDNDYGHPHKEIVEIFNEYEVDVYRTDKLGTLHVTSDGEEYKVETLDIHLDGNK